jgi:hypothetical protein
MSLAQSSEILPAPLAGGETVNVPTPQVLSHCILTHPGFADFKTSWGFVHFLVFFSPSSHDSIFAQILGHVTMDRVCDWSVSDNMRFNARGAQGRRRLVSIAELHQT